MGARIAWEAVRYECKKREECRGCVFWTMCFKKPYLWTDEDIRRAEGLAEKLADDPEKEPEKAEPAPTYAEVFARMKGGDPMVMAVCRNYYFGAVGICALAGKYPARSAVQRRRIAHDAGEDEACRACWNEKCREEGKR